MGLFTKQDIVLHSGQKTDFKIECDDLSYSDVETLCYLISKRFKFYNAFGVPNGGIKFAECLTQYRACVYDTKLPILIVDDVLTTGKSINEFEKAIRPHYIKKHKVIGVVIFARGKCPSWVTPMFQMWQ